MPWIARRDLDRLYAIIERLTDHQNRIERVSAGLGETPPPPRKVIPPMPNEVLDWIRSHDGQAVQDRLHKEANAAARKAGGWDSVLYDIRKATQEEG